MSLPITKEYAKYYDLCRVPLDDVGFYRRQIPYPQARVLELGCGTGRVLTQLAEHCGSIHGLDQSEAMLAICYEKLQAAVLPPERASVEVGDITDFNLGQAFDLIIAPFRVMQLLVTDAEVDGLFACIRRHIALNGTAILNVFRPNMERGRMLAEWCQLGEIFDSDTPIGDGRLVRYHTRPWLDSDPLVIYPELISRWYEGETLVEEAVLPLAMRCYYPNEFLALIESHGFRVTGKWGGYAGEPYGEGPELVVAFN
ncbi:MAG: class I SAM-dependent DNA methyltransferase [Armatimonadota bacterium]